jgi:N6-L-threonylcarbamoyladenine synthase/protein kinase Bud32
MDTGVGNAIDKFTRHLDWAHPGGPKVERHAKRGEFHPLPYVVKGMDFSFSGIMSAAKEAVDDGVPVDDVCRGLEETIFAMLTEVSERALSLTDADELVLGGGVGQNARLQGMLREMCDQRGAEFYAPENRFLRDNAGMIAMLGAKMHAAGDTLAVAESGIDADFRPDEVAVTWRGDETVGTGHRGATEGDAAVQGAEATVRLWSRTASPGPTAIRDSTSDCASSGPARRSGLRPTHAATASRRRWSGTSTPSRPASSSSASAMPTSGTP